MRIQWSVPLPSSFHDSSKHNCTTLKWSVGSQHKRKIIASVTPAPLCDPLFVSNLGATATFYIGRQGRRATNDMKPNDVMKTLFSHNFYGDDFLVDSRRSAILSTAS